MSTLEVPGVPRNYCRVIAHQAKGLIYKGKDNTNNVFVTFTIGKNKFATSILEKTQTPEWNEECELPISNLNGILELVVCHDDFLRERFLGRVEIPVRNVAEARGNTIKKWYPLLPKKGHEGKKSSDRGQLEVTVQVSYHGDVGNDQDKTRRSSLFDILHSPGRKKSSGDISDDGRQRRHSHTMQEDFMNNLNQEMQFHDQPFEDLHSDDTQSMASSVSDDYRERKSSLPKTPTSQQRFRPGGMAGSARGKGAVKNKKNAPEKLKPMDKEHMTRIGLSTPDLRFTSASSEPPTPAHRKQRHHRQSEGTDEPDSASRAPSHAKDSKNFTDSHVGVSGLISTLHNIPAPRPEGRMTKAVSEECLLSITDKDDKESGQNQEDVNSFTLPRGRRAKHEARHKKTMSACITTLSDLSQPSNHGNFNHDQGKKNMSNIKEGKEPKSSGPSKYDTLTKQQLVQLIQQQESILSDNIKYIKELETYLDGLLIKVILESPQLLDQNHPICL